MCKGISHFAYGRYTQTPAHYCEENTCSEGMVRCNGKLKYIERNAYRFIVKCEKCGAEYAIDEYVEVAI